MISKEEWDKIGEPVLPPHMKEGNIETDTICRCSECFELIEFCDNCGEIFNPSEAPRQKIIHIKHPEQEPFGGCNYYHIHKKCL